MSSWRSSIWVFALLFLAGLAFLTLSPAQAALRPAQDGLAVGQTLMSAPPFLLSPTPIVREFAVVTNPADQVEPAISGNVIVWTDYRNGNADIYGQDLTSGREFAVVTNPADQEYPAISGNLVVWMDERNGNEDIYGQDLATGREFAVVTNPADQEYPAINGNLVVWTDNRNGSCNLPPPGNCDIYGKDLATGQEFAVVTNPATQSGPAISGNLVVWTDNRNGNGNIYGARLEWPEAAPTPTPTPTPSSGRKYVIFLQGLGTKLSTDSCPQGCESTFDEIKEKLRDDYGYQEADFLEFSYKGGEVKDGRWRPNPYSCSDTGQDIFGSSAGALSKMINDFKEKADPNGRFVLVGHSLGGLVALQELLYVVGDKLSPGTIEKVITLDSPLGGVSHSTLVILAGMLPDFLCFPLDAFAAMELSALADSPNTEPVNNAMVTMAQAKGTEISTLGNQWDCVFNPLKCLVPSSNQWGTQIIKAARNSNGYYLWGFPRWLPPLFNLTRSHGLILSEAGPVADIAKIIGPQMGFSPRSR